MCTLQALEYLAYELSSPRARKSGDAAFPIFSDECEFKVWVGFDNADIRFRFIARGPVEHDTKIVAFTATPKDPALDMHVDPRSGLEIQLQRTGIIGYDITALNLLQMIEHHIRWDVIGLWFEHGRLPWTWAQVEATQ